MPPRNAEAGPLAGPGHLKDASSASLKIPEADDSSALCDAFVVIVSTDDEKHRRRVFLSLHAAEKALRRSWAAGHRAEMLLCHLSPVSSLTDPVAYIGSLTLCSHLPVGVA